MNVVEQLAIDRAKELFGAEHVNVQPHSGSQANFAVYYGLLHQRYGDRLHIDFLSFFHEYLRRFTSLDVSSLCRLVFTGCILV